MANFYQGKKVFIAGGAGLCGQALIRKLVPMGARITATERTRKIAEAWKMNVSTTAVDLNLVGTNHVYEGQEIVFWCAARVGGAKAIRENPSDLIHYNLELAARNIKAAVGAGVERFAFISSSYVYPELDRPAKEEDVWSGDVPQVHYGLGWIKRYLETLCIHHHMTSKTKFAIVRPTAIFGPHDDFDLETCHALPALLRKVVELPTKREGTLEVWGDGSEERQWTYVDDLADGLLRVVEDYCVAEPLNVCTQETNTVKDLVKALMALENRPPRTVFSDAILGNTTVTTVRYLADKPTAIAKRISDPSKAKRLLGVECRTSLEEGLKKTLAWYKENR